MAYEAKATVRTDTGKGKVRKMRRAGTIPAVVYGHGDPSVMLALDTHEFNRLLDEIRGRSPIVDLEVDGESSKCVIKTLQRNPIDGSLLHVDFQKVHAHEKITMNVPVILHGTAEGVKEGGLLDPILREVPVRATIDKVPAHFDIDISRLKMGDSVHIRDLEAADIEFVLPLEATIVTVLTPRKLVATAAEAAAAGEAVEAAEEGAKEPEVITEKKAETEKPEEKKKK